MNTHTNSTLPAQLGNISTTQPWEQNEKQVLTVFLQTVAKAQAPDAGQLATLLAVGEQCPRTGGPAAVFLAAMLYEGFTGFADDFFGLFFFRRRRRKRGCKSGCPLRAPGRT
ncbi:MAG: hypothetical protein JNJ90_10650 [Saprospiraceae bacterium]|nr:hypothetical protein [Saprospiraceae bacterium]